MARYCDANDDLITFGSDATIDNFTAMTIAFWVQPGTLSAQRALVAKNTSGWGIITPASGNLGYLIYFHYWSGGLGLWVAPTQIIAENTPAHVAVTYDGSSSSNAPIIYLNGVSQGNMTLQYTPSGSLTADGGYTLSMGANSDGTALFQGAFQNFVYHNAVLDAAQINRLYRWGRLPGMKVYHPFFTTKLANEGTATANASLTGTTMTNIPRVIRDL